LTIDTIPIPPPSHEALTETSELMRAAGSYVNLVLHHWKTDPTKPIGTAVMMRAGERLFAITADHCVADDTAIIFPRKDRRRDVGRILNRFTRPDIDLAVLELEAYAPATACDIGQLSVEPPPVIKSDQEFSRHNLQMVVGFPALRARLKGDTLNSTVIAFVTNTVRASETEFELYYHQPADTHGVDPKHLTLGDGNLPEHPEGFSGAGVWSFVPPKAGEIFNPLRHIRLLGIQRAWLPKSRLLKCIPTRAIVDLLRESVPEVNPLLPG
jgi:hypothetical protein